MFRMFTISIAGSFTILLGGCVPGPDGTFIIAGSNPTPPRPSYSPPAGPPAPAPVAVAMAGPFSLPPVVLPLNEEWSPAQCRNLAVRFSGPMQNARTRPSDAVSFQEARQYREGDYYEFAECFCAKSGDLSETTKATADSLMAQTAQRFADMSRVRIREIGFVEQSPVGKYSELEAAGGPPIAPLQISLRTHWRSGQCSVRLATMASPSERSRARQFLESLHEVKQTAAGAAHEPASPAAEPAATAPQNFAAQVVARAAALEKSAGIASPPPVAEMPGNPSTSVAVSEVSASARSVEGLNAPAPTPDIVPAVSRPGNASAVPAPAGAFDPVARLKQLKALAESGLISKEEYAAKRKSVLDSL
jgi:hypothetical protein